MRPADGAWGEREAVPRVGPEGAAGRADALARWRQVAAPAVAEVGAALRYATVQIVRARRDPVPPPEDPWMREVPVPAAGDGDEDGTPFWR